jgi:hypothetical protein
LTGKTALFNRTKVLDDTTVLELTRANAKPLGGFTLLQSETLSKVAARLNRQANERRIGLVASTVTEYFDLSLF